MRTPRAVAVALFALAAFGCGEKEPQWTELAPRTAPPSVAALTGDERTLAEAIARSQARLLEAPALVALMNPMAGQVDIPEAARRTAKLVEACRADSRVLGGVADALGERYPDPKTAPVAILLAQTRAAAYRFREWALVELLNAMGSLSRDLLARGTPSSAEILFAAASLDGIRYGHEGAILLRRYLALAPEAYRRALAASEPLALGDLCYDIRMMATAWGPAQWNDKEAPIVKKLVADYRAASTALPGPAGAALARLVTRWWDWGTAGTGSPLDAAKTAETVHDLRALARALPASAHGLETLAAQVQSGY